MTGSSDPLERPDSLADDLRRWRVAAGVPGATVVLADAGGRVEVLTDGLADVEHAVALRPDHRFEIGSISKSLTAIAILRLADRGRLRLEDRVRRHLPWFRAGEHGAAITIRHLLTHTGGIPNGADMGDASAFDVWALRDTDSLPPGSLYWYSNAGYKTLGLVMETVADAPFPDVLRAEALVPFEMDDALPAVRQADRHRAAVGYEPEPNVYPRSLARRVPSPAIEISMGDGSVSATAMDMGRYAAGLLRALAGMGNRGDGPLGQSSITGLAGRHVRTGPDRWYGYGLAISRSGAPWTVGHGGDTLGFGASLLCDPAAGLAVVVLANLRAARTGDLARHVLSSLVARRAGLPSAAFEAPRPAVEWVASSRFRGLAGDLRLSPGDDAPYLERDGVTRRLIDRGGGRFEVDDPQLGRYLLHVDSTAGRLTRVVHGPNVFWAEGSSPPGATEGRGSARAPGTAYPGSYRSHNPWRRAVDVLRREGRLVIVEDDGAEDDLVRIAAGRYRIGRKLNPERMAFDAVVDGRALRAVAGGVPFVRTA